MSGGRRSGWWWASVASSSLGIFGCPGVPPTTGGTTDVSATDGTHGAETSGGQEGVDETGTGGDEPFDHRTYFIGESVKFDGGGECDNDNLIAITRSLRTRLDNAGWTGTIPKIQPMV